MLRAKRDDVPQSKSQMESLIELPQLMVRRRGERFARCLSWECHLSDGEALSDTATAVTQFPSASESILRDTTHTDSVSRIDFAIPSNAACGIYHFTHRVMTTAGRSYMECFSVLVESC